MPDEFFGKKKPDEINQPSSIGNYSGFLVHLFL